MTLRVRLAVVVAGAVAAAVLVALGVAFLFTHHRLRAEVDDALEDRAASLELARQVAAAERGREVRRRFLGTGTPYTPQTVNFYGN